MKQLENLVQYCVLIQNFSLINFDNCDDQEIDELLDLNDEQLNISITRRSGLRSKHIDRILKTNSNVCSSNIAIYGTTFTDEQFLTLLNLNDAYINGYLAEKN
jgi:hypothetical protein